MKKLFKYLGIGLGLIILLLIAAVVILPLVIDPNDYRDQITELVKEQTGRELRIEGDIKLSVFPWLGISLGKMELSNAPGFGPEPFARLQGAEVSVKLLPLLKKAVEMDTVTLKGLEAYLGRNQEGISNWDDLIKPTSAPEGEQAPTTEQAPADPTQLLAALAIGGIEISHAKAVWDDRSTAQHFEIDNLNLRTGALSLTKPFSVELALDLRSRNPAVSGHLALTSAVGLNLSQQRYRLNGLSLAVDAQGAIIPGGKASVRLRSEVVADLQQQTLALQGLKVQTMGSELSADIEATQLLALPDLQGSLQLAINDPTPLLQALATQLPIGMDLSGLKGGTLKTQFDISLGQQTLKLTQLDLNALGAQLSAQASGTQIIDSPIIDGQLALKVVDGAKLLAPIATALPPSLKPADLNGASLSTGYALNLGAQTAALTGLKLSALELDLSANTNASQIIDAPNITGSLKLAEFVPQDLLHRLGIVLDMADPSALSKASLSTDFSAGLDHAGLDKLNLRFDDSRLSGSLSTKQFAKPVLRYTLVLDTIDVDRYLPPPAPAGTPLPATPATAAAAGALQLPLELMRGLDIDGSFTLGKLKVMNLHSSEIHATLKASQGLFKVYPVGARLYQGTYTGNLALDVRGNAPRTAMDERLKGVQIGPLLKDFMGKDYVTGEANLGAKLTASGLEPMAIRQSLSGKADFSFKDGALNGLSVSQLIHEAYTKEKGWKQPDLGEDKTVFSILSGSATITNGLVSNHDLLAKSSKFTITGKGTAHLATEQLDYTLNTHIAKNIGKTLQDLADTTVPVHITGSFTEPKFRVDVATILKTKAKSAIDAERARLNQELKARQQAEQERLKQKAEEEKKRLQEDLKKKLRDKLKF